VHHSHWAVAIWLNAIHPPFYDSPTK